jgi:hypothetical protein
VTHLRLKIPAGEGRWIAAIHSNGKVLDQKVSGKHLMVEAVVSSSFAATLNPDWILQTPTDAFGGPRINNQP